MKKQSDSWQLKLTVFIILLLLSNINSSAQFFAWAKSMGGSGLENGRSIGLDSAGNVYTVGTFSGTGDFDPGAATFNLVSAGNDDVFISKLDALGNFIWAKRIGGIYSENGMSISVDASANMYITGSFYGTVDFNPNAGVTNLTSTSSSSDMFIVKLDSSGSLLWAKQIGGSGTSDNIGISITQDATGNVYTTGHFYGTTDFNPGVGVFNLISVATTPDVFVCKLDATGNFVWAKSVGGNGSDYPYGIAVDGLGNVIFSGYFETTVDFDPGASVSNLTTLGSGDAFVCKLDMSGNFLWAKQFGSVGNYYVAYSVAVDIAGNVYSSGDFAGSGDFDPGAAIFNLTSAGGRDAFISKLDASGTFVWAKSLGGSGTDDAFAITLDAASNVYTTGYFTGTGDYDPGAGVTNLVSIGAAYTIFVSALNSSGTFLSATCFGGGAGGTVPRSITVDAPGNLYIAGDYFNSADFDPSASTYNLTSAAASDIFVEKLAPCASAPLTPGTISGATTICSGTSNTYSITAVSGATSYTWTMPSGWSGTSTTNSITTTASTTSGNITVTANNTCGNSFAQTLAIIVNTIPTTPGTISGAASMCAGAGSTTYNITSVVGATSYTWTLPGGWSGTSTSNIIVVTPGTSSGTISVTANNTCGNSTPQTLAVTINPLPTVTYTQSPSTVCINATAVVLGTASPSGGTFSGTAVTGSTFNASVAGSGTFPIVYTFTDVNSCTNTASSNIIVDACTNVQQNVNEYDILIYPNPSTGFLNFSLGNISADVSIEIIDITGRIILSKTFKNVNKDVISLNEISNGSYVVRFTSENKITHRNIIIAK